MTISNRDQARSEFNMEILVGYILLGGVLLSGAFLIAGLTWRWAATGHFRLQYTISGTNLFQFWMADIRQVQLMDFRPRLLVNLGIAILMITPYLRVLTSMIYFAFVERNIKYSLFTGFVFTVLTYSLFLR